MHPANDGDECFKGSTWSDAQVAAHINYATFGAHYLCQGKKMLSMAWRAEVSFIEAHDHSHDTCEQQYWAVFLVPAAATWFTQAAMTIHNMCRDSNGVRGYSLESWAFWKCRFLEIAANEHLMISIRDMAPRAASEMDKVDGEMQQCQKATLIVSIHVWRHDIMKGLSNPQSI